MHTLFYKLNEMVLFEEYVEFVSLLLDVNQENKEIKKIPFSKAV